MASLAHVRSALPGPASSPSGPVEPVNRSAALDVLRGVTIVGMVLVNNPGSGAGYRQLSHSPWNGATFADLVFPGFLFVMGVALAFSQADHRGSLSRAGSVGRILRRSLLLVALGVGLNVLIPLSGGAVRYPGVLQRIGLAYLIAALVVLWLPVRGQALFGLALLAGYWFVLLHVAVPGSGAGVLTPAGNLAGYVDRSLLGQAHLYRHQPYDPEGLLSTAGAVVTVLAGSCTGQWLRRRGRTSMASVGLAAAAALALGLGWWWGRSLPFNKRIWSPSYTVWTAGWLALSLALLWELIEVRGWRRLRQPWVVLGANALVLYVATELGDRVLGLVHIGRLTAHAWTFDRWFGSWLAAAPASLLWSLAFVAVWGAGSAVLWRRRILIRL